MLRPINPIYRSFSICCLWPPHWPYKILSPNLSRPKKVHVLQNCYKQWIATRPTTAPNGLVQGCSLSLLAINLQRSVWTLMLRKLPEIQAAVFIDDSYLWTNAIHLSLLQQAVSITHEWDEIVGQTLNMRKCQIWATSSKHRTKLCKCFPTMKLVLNLEVLGATVHTANISKCERPSKKTAKNT